MTSYHVTGHALTRFRERFTGLASLHGDDRGCMRCLINLAQRAHAVGSQAHMELMLKAEIRTVTGMVTCFLAVAPKGHHDEWSIKTVLTEDQAERNLALHAEHHRQNSRSAWRAKKRFIRPDSRSWRIAARKELAQVA